MYPYTKSARMRADPIGDQLKVYQYPLQTNTVSPKIPDGKAEFSVGIRQQTTVQIKMTDNIMDMAFFPGLNNGLTFINGRLTDNGLHEFNAPYPNGVVVAVKSNVQFGGPDNALTRIEQYRKHITTEKEAFYRVVSQQLKITNINSGDDYDGWWECVRMPCIPSNFELFYTEAANPTATTADLSMFPGKRGTNLNTDAATFEVVDQNSMLNNSTYCTGKIKDLHRYNFQLLPNKNDHDFVHLLEECATFREMKQLLFDPTMDCLYFRFHGVGEPQALALPVPGKPTTLMMHVVSNQEYIYKEDAPNIRFHTECYDANDMVRAARKNMHRDTKSAKPMYNGGV